MSILVGPGIPNIVNPQHKPSANNDVYFGWIKSIAADNKDFGGKLTLDGKALSQHSVSEIQKALGDIKIGTGPLTAHQLYIIFTYVQTYLKGASKPIDLRQVIDGLNAQKEQIVQEGRIRYGHVLRDIDPSLVTSQPTVSQPAPPVAAAPQPPVMTTPPTPPPPVVMPLPPVVPQAPPQPPVVPPAPVTPPVLPPAPVTLSLGDAVASINVKLEGPLTIVDPQTRKSETFGQAAYALNYKDNQLTLMSWATRKEIPISVDGLPDGLKTQEALAQKLWSKAKSEIIKDAESRLSGQELKPQMEAAGIKWERRPETLDWNLMIPAGYSWLGKAPSANAHPFPLQLIRAQGENGLPLKQIEITQGDTAKKFVITIVPERGSRQSYQIDTSAKTLTEIKPLAAPASAPAPAATSSSSGGFNLQLIRETVQEFNQELASPVTIQNEAKQQVAYGPSSYRIQVMENGELKVLYEPTGQTLPLPYDRSTLNFADPRDVKAKLAVAGAEVITQHVLSRFVRNQEALVALKSAGIGGTFDKIRQEGFIYIPTSYTVLGQTRQPGDKPFEIPMQLNRPLTGGIANKTFEIKQRQAEAAHQFDFVCHEISGNTVTYLLDTQAKTFGRVQ